MSGKIIFRTALLLTAACLGVAGLAGCDDGGGGAPAIDAPTGTAIDAPVAPPIDAPPGTGPDAGGGGNAAEEINCGMATCPRASQVCCFTGPPTIMTSCTAAASCTNLPGRCDGPEDCASGQVCCGGQMGSSCVAADQCTGFSARLCHTMADCPSGQICRASQFVAWPICANS